MNIDNKNQLNFEVDLRLSDSGWDEMIADRIVSSVREKRNRFIKRNAILSAVIAILFSVGFLQMESDESITPVVEAYVSPGYEGVLQSTFTDNANIVLTGFMR